MQKIFSTAAVFIFLTACAPLAEPLDDLSAAGSTQPTTQAGESLTSSESRQVITPENINQLEVLERWGKGNVYDVDISPDGETIAVATSTGVYLYDVETLEETVIFPAEKDESLGRGSVAFSPDGSFLAVAYERISIWNLNDQVVETYVRFSSSVLSNYEVDKIGFTNDGQQIILMGKGLLASCDASGGIFQVFDLKQSKLLYHRYYCRWNGYIRYFRSLPEGTIVITSIDPSDWTYKTVVVESATGEVIKTLYHDTTEVIYDIDPKGSVMAVRPSKLDEGLTFLIDLNSSEVVKEIDENIVFLPTPDYFLAQDRGSIDTWRLIDFDGNTICQFNDESHELRLANYDIQSNFIRERHLVVWSDYYKEIQVWNITNCTLVQNIFIPNVERSIVFSLDEKNIENTDFNNGSLRESGKLAPNGKMYLDKSSEGLRIFDFDDEKNGLIIGEHNPRFIQDYFFSPDNARIAVMEWSSKVDIAIYFYDIETRNLIKEFSAPRGRLYTISPDWKYLIFVDKDDYINIWDFEKGIALHKLPGHRLIAGESHSLAGLVFSPDGKMFASLERANRSSNGVVRFWEVSTGKLLGEIIPDFPIDGISFSPDGTVIATTGDGTIRIWGIPLNIQSPSP